ACRFFNDLLNLSGRPTEKAQQRQTWYQKAVKAVAGCPLVFLDPDDGLPRPGRSPTHKGGPKSAFYHEIAGFLLRVQSVVTIQYPAREDEEARYCRYVDPLKLYCTTGSEPTVIRFRKIKHPRFVVLSQPNHRQAIERAVESVLSKHSLLFERV